MVKYCTIVFCSAVCENEVSLHKPVVTAKSGYSSFHISILFELGVFFSCTDGSVLDKNRLSAYIQECLDMSAQLPFIISLPIWFWQKTYKKTPFTEKEKSVNILRKTIFLFIGSKG